MCTKQVPPGGYPIAVQYIISYRAGALKEPVGHLLYEEEDIWENIEVDGGCCWEGCHRLAQDREGEGGSSEHVRQQFAKYL
jgi:hypothetical protein